MPKSLEKKKEERAEKLKINVKNYKNKIYKNQGLHLRLKKKDRMKKRLYRKNKKKTTKKQTQTELEENRRKERERKQKYREKQKPRSLLCTPEEVKVKLRKNTIMVTNRLRRKQLKTSTPEPSTKIKKRIQSNNTLSPTTSPLKVSKFLWNSLTPKSRRKAKLKLKETDTPAGLSHQFREEMGVNSSNSISSSYEREIQSKQK